VSGWSHTVCYRSTRSPPSNLLAEALSMVAGHPESRAVSGGGEHSAAWRSAYTAPRSATADAAWTAAVTTGRPHPRRRASYDRGRIVGARLPKSFEFRVAAWIARSSERGSNRAPAVSSVSATGRAAPTIAGARDVQPPGDHAPSRSPDAEGSFAAAGDVSYGPLMPELPPAGERAPPTPPGWFYYSGL